MGELILSFEVEIPGFDLETLGLEIGAIDLAIAAANGDHKREEKVPDGPPVSRVGDVWLLNQHRVVCGDACLPSTLATLMIGRQAQAVFADPPFGCAIDGFVAGRGRHREFVMGSGDISQPKLVDPARRTSPVLGFPLRLDRAIQCHAHWDQV